MNWLERQVQIRPHAVAVRYAGAAVTWEDLARRTNRIAAALQLAGVRPGARVATLVGNGIDFVALLHASMWTGVSLVPLNTKLADMAISEQLRDSSADLLVIDHGAANRSLDLGHVRFVQIEELTYSVGSDPVAVRPEAEATIVYTSGTSGRAKPVRLTWKNHEASAIANALNLGLHADDEWLCCLPMFHVGGMAIAFRCAIYGMRMSILEQFEPTEALDAIESGATIVSLVPTMLSKLADAAGGVDALASRLQPTKLRAILLGGGPADPGFVADCLMAGLPICQTYGMTETSSQIASVPPDRAPEKIGSAGFPVWGAEISIRDHEGEPVRDARSGIVWVRGPMVTAGYLDRPEVNREQFVAGWFKTGDVGRLDDDGYLWIEGRHDEVIITGGENVSPHEVERVLRSHPGVRDAAVFGLPDAEWGQRVAAAVVLGQPELGSADIDAFCENLLAAHQRPRALFVVEELPRTTSGKVRREALRQRFLT